MAVSDEWFDWPALPDLFPASFPGVKTSRDGFLVDVDLDRLKKRIGDYFDAALNHEEIAQRYPGAMKTTARFNAREVREKLVARGGPDGAGFIRFAYRPFDNRWLYWESGNKTARRKARRLQAACVRGESVAGLTEQVPRLRRDAAEPQAVMSRQIWPTLNQMNSGVYCVPLWLGEDGLVLNGDGMQRRLNLSGVAQSYLEHLGTNAQDLFHHVLAVLHDSTYNQVNADALRAKGPRIPLLAWPDGETEGAAEALAKSAERGCQLARLLELNTPVPLVTEAPLRPESTTISVPSTRDGHNMGGEDFAVTAGWGHYGKDDAVMPGQGRVVERSYTPDERATLGDSLPVLGENTFDVHLNGSAFWRNVPATVWTYQLGGYQVLKKWLSYRERAILKRPLSDKEVQYFTDAARRIAAILQLANE